MDKKRIKYANLIAIQCNKLRNNLSLIVADSKSDFRKNRFG